MSERKKTSWLSLVSMALLISIAFGLASINIFDIIASIALPGDIKEITLKIDDATALNESLHHALVLLQEESALIVESKNTLILSLSATLEQLEQEIGLAQAEKDTLILSLKNTITQLENDTDAVVEEKETLIMSLNNAVEELEKSVEEIDYTKSFWLNLKPVKSLLGENTELMFNDAFEVELFVLVKIGALTDHIKSTIVTGLDYVEGISRITVDFYEDDAGLERVPADTFITETTTIFFDYSFRLHSPDFKSYLTTDTRYLLYMRDDVFADQYIGEEVGYIYDTHSKKYYFGRYLLVKIIDVKNGITYDEPRHFSPKINTSDITNINDYIFEIRILS